MKKVFKLLFAVIVFFVLGYFALGYISSFVGWYGYKKWRYRVSTSDIEESKKRGVFVKELHFQIDSFSGTLENFKPYIEKGFKFGLHSSKETIPLKNSNYPYQLRFNYRPSNEITILIREDELIKFDSANASWGYLKHPEITDTIILIIRGENVHSGNIKVWQ
ncbi:hypothetical protein [Flavihumibacter profundi]|uniref:hypothetical protein n=1 Tax=Flavihumibacter profundi TaxID=2716883 RepID=UPI001CC558DD|nr:hypothetical protein [Flavihumibacter profundi]MBZ5858557.1 hypothetical protein [Flavihumibacter profundi]